MGRKPERKNLGRGLSALLGDVAASGPSTPTADDTPSLEVGVNTIAVDLIHPNPDQPRREFNEADLAELANSIRERGIIQPIIVRPDPKIKNGYQIVAGERRWRAAQRAQLHQVPVVIRELDDRDVLELALIENIQRADLNPVEEAQAYAQLIEKFSYTQEELAKILGKSRPHLANTLRLLMLPDGVLSLLRLGRLTAGHARALINAPFPEKLAEEVVAKGLTVRQTEDLARKIPSSDLPGKTSKPKEKDADTRQLEGDLSAALAMRVSIEHVGSEGGELRIRYKSLDDLDRLCQALGG